MSLRTCVICGVEFQKKRSGRNRGLCCSRTCGFKWMRLEGAKRRQSTAARNEAQRIAALPKCEVCMQRCPSSQRKTCGLACRRKRTAQLAIGRYRMRTHGAVRLCSVCGAPCLKPAEKYITKYCSKQCRRRMHQRRKTTATARAMAGISGSVHARRARRLGRPVERGVTPLAVFRRCSWICQICGRQTLKEKHPRSGPRSLLAPELDHIIPLSKGGGHTHANTQCLCRECNNTKQDRVESAAVTLVHVNLARLVRGLPVINPPVDDERVYPSPLILKTVFGDRAGGRFCSVQVGRSVREPVLAGARG